MAEVKVKVTAQNETRTGFQQALNDAKQFGNEATRSVTIDDEAALAPLRKIQQQLRDVQADARRPITDAPSGGGDEFASANVRGAAAIRGLATDLANASGPAQIFEAIIRRISTAMGGLIAATAGFAIGSIIAKTLREAAAGVEDLANKSQALQTSFANLSAPTTSFDQLSSAIRGAADEIKALQDANQKLQSGIGFQLADYASSFDLSTAANQATESGVNSARINLASAISAAASRELELAQARTDEERKLISLQAARQDLLNQARAADAASGAQGGGRGTVEGELTRLFATQDQRGEQDRERSLQAQADKQRAINEENLRSTEERLAREKQGLADLEQFGGAGIDLLREQATARIRDLERQITAEKERAADVAQREAEQRAQATKRAAQSLASELEQRDFAALSPADKQAKIAADQAALLAGLESGAINPAEGAQRALELIRREEGLAAGSAPGGVSASGLQRIGLADNEFVRREKDTTAAEVRQTKDLLREAVNILKNSDGLYLSTN
jgi:hypothetical protein